MTSKRKNELILRNLCDLALEANDLLKKFRTKEHRVESWYASEFEKVEVRLASLSEILTQEVDGK